MAEYIEREALLRELESPRLFNVTPRILEIVNETPAADVAQVRHGQWFELTESIHDTHTDEYFNEVYYNCSLCDYAADVKTLYCPNCGARMDGGVKE